MRYAQIVVGVKGHGKSTYCNLMSNFAESQERVMKVVNLDPTADILPHLDTVIADIREKVSPDAYNEAESQSQLRIGGGFEFVLKHILANPDWLFGAIGGDEAMDGDSILFDCPGQPDFHAHVNILQDFGALLMAKDFRVCVIFIQDARLSTDGYSYISSCFTSLISYINLALPHINVMMKVDLLTDDDKSQLLLFITSEIQEVLRYENNKRGGIDRKLDQIAESAVVMLDGHSLFQRKYFLLDIREEQELQGVLTIVDDCFGNPEDED